MSILDDILKIVDDSEEFTEAEKKSIRADCKKAWEMEMGGGE
jgi:hypothetical protein